MIATCRCPSLEPFASVGGGAHRPLTTLCPPPPSLACPRGGGGGAPPTVVSRSDTSLVLVAAVFGSVAVEAAPAHRGRCCPIHALFLSQEAGGDISGGCCFFWGGSDLMGCFLPFGARRVWNSVTNSRGAHVRFSRCSRTPMPSAMPGRFRSSLRCWAALCAWRAAACPLSGHFWYTSYWNPDPLCDT